MAACDTESCALGIGVVFPPESSPFSFSSFAPFASPPAEAGGPPSTPRTPPRRPSPPPPPRRSTALPPSPSPSRMSTGVVVGIVIGCAAAVLLVLIFVYFLLSKKRKGTQNHHAHDQKLPPIIGDQYNGLQINPNPPEKYMMPRPSPPPPAVRTMLSYNYPSRPPAASLKSSSSSGSNYSGFEGPVRAPFHGMSPCLSKNMFTYEELHVATDAFSSANFLGEGGFGYVHKGVLPNGEDVAVKSLKLGSLQGEREFQAEVDIISRVHHRHLVSLVGYCVSGQQRLLVYDFVPNNTLEFHLHGMGQPTMDWPTRLKIALGSAKGFAYLHEDCHPRIIHRDIKAANILLDFTFDAKVADFGLAKVCSDAYTHVTTRVMGTFGYLAPEYASTGKLTEKSDVYSFGVVLLELITGHRPIGSKHSYMDYSLVEWARPLLTEALEDNTFDSLVDKQLQNNYNLNEIVRVISCADSCVRHSAHHRPKMSMVARVLEGEVSLADLNKGMEAGQNPVVPGPQRSSENESGEQRRVRKMGLGNPGSSEYGGTTSETDLYPSSSSDNHQP